MRNLLILAAAASLAVGCHNRSEDEVGAAPNRGDTTRVASDTAKAVQTDTTMGQAKTSTMDTTTSMAKDSTMAHDTIAPGVTPDSALTKQNAPNTDSTKTKAWPDSTSAQPTDSTAPAKQ